MALIIAGERSGVGKTTITLALLSFLSRQGHKVQSFKVGPDYIDPMFHTAVTGRPCRNLDPILTSREYVRSCFARHCQGVDYTLIEGVMGLFDGVRFPDANAEGTRREGLSLEVSSRVYTPRPLRDDDYASTAHIARLLNLPILLVIDCSRLSGSVAAIAHGYRSFDPRINIAGVILNRVGSDRHLELLTNALEPLNLLIVGVLRRQDNLTIPDRHLGLVPSAELPHLNQLFDRLAHLARTCFNWDILLPLLSPLPLQPTPSPLHPFTPCSVKIAVAYDRAFSFYYQDNLDILEQLGAELIFWSPIDEPSLPQGVQGLYFGGGFPEMFAQNLAENQLALQAVRKAVNSGMPTYAECGGLMYLCERLIDFDGKAWPMVGMIPSTATMSKQLTLGYRQATAYQDSLLLEAGETVWGHEFHRSVLTTSGQSPLYKMKGLLVGSSPVDEGWCGKHFHASYLHLHFGGHPTIARRFLDRCLAFLELMR